MQKNFVKDLVRACLWMREAGHEIYFDDFYGYGEMPYIKLGETRTYLVDTDEDGELFVRGTVLLEEIIKERTGK